MCMYQHIVGLELWPLQLGNSIVLNWRKCVKIKQMENRVISSNIPNIYEVEVHKFVFDCWNL